MTYKFSLLNNSLLRSIIFITGLFLLSSCSDGVINLDDKQKVALKFDELPATIKMTIENNLNDIENDNGDFFISTDSTIVFQYGRGGGGGKGWLQEVNSNKHHFFINGRHLTMRGNRGAPFILDNYQLYYNNELNSFKRKYKECVYFKIDLLEDVH